MKNITIGIIIALSTLALLSYKSTDNKEINFSRSTIYSCITIPVKQRDVIVTDKEDDVKKLIKKGYTVQDVDVLVVPGTFKSLVKYYTLILN